MSLSVSQRQILGAVVDLAAPAVAEQLLKSALNSAGWALAANMRQRVPAATTRGHTTAAIRRAIMAMPARVHGEQLRSKVGILRRIANKPHLHLYVLGTRQRWTRGLTKTSLRSPQAQPRPAFRGASPAHPVVDEAVAASIDQLATIASRAVGRQMSLAFKSAIQR